MSSGASGSIMGGSAARGTSGQRKAEEYEEEEEKQQPNVNIFGPLIGYGGTEDLMISDSDVDPYAMPKLARTHT